jgi:cytochrome P450
MFRKADFSSFLPPIVAKFLGQSVFRYAPKLLQLTYSTNGDQWKGQRVIMNPAFADVSGFTDIFTQKTIKALDRLKTKDTNAIPIDKMLVKLTLDILGQTIFDYDFKLLDSEDINDKYVKAYQYIIKHMNDPIRVLGGKMYEKLPLQANKDIYEANDTLNELVNNVAEKARKEYDPDVAPRSLLEMILRTRDAETGHVFTEQELRDNMIIFFVSVRVVLTK